MKSGYITILGAPNAGKSRLLNAILGEKIAAVTDKPQTTRQKLAGIYSTKTCQMIFLDTPGIHTSQKNLNIYMMEEVRHAIRDADVLLFLLASDEPVNDEMKKLIEEVQQKYPKKKKVWVVNKIDLVGARFPRPQLMGGGTLPLPISALHGTGVPELLLHFESLLPEGPAYYPDDQLTDKNLRDLAAEIIREKAMQLMYEEIPYSLAVEIVSFEEPVIPAKAGIPRLQSGDPRLRGDDTLTRIAANIIVEHESQKGMVIGAGGKMIKQIGVLSRADLEKLVGTQVFLKLEVKVDKNWTKKPDRLARYGYKTGT